MWSLMDVVVEQPLLFLFSAQLLEGHVAASWIVCSMIVIYCCVILQSFFLGLMVPGGLSTRSSPWETLEERIGLDTTSIDFGPENTRFLTSWWRVRSQISVKLTETSFTRGTIAAMVESPSAGVNPAGDTEMAELSAEMLAEICNCVLLPIMWKQGLRVTLSFCS